MKNFFFIFMAIAFSIKAFTAQVLFAAGEEISTHFIELIGKEKESVQLAVDQLSHRKIISALREAKKRGVSVEVIVDRKCMAHLNELLEVGIPVYIYDKGRKHAPHMNHRFCIFGRSEGQPLIWSGTFRFVSGNHRDNVLLTGENDVVGAYLQEFQRMKNDSNRKIREVKS